MIKVRRKRSWIEKLKNWICYLIPNKIPIVLKENWDMLSRLGALNSDESFSFIWALTRVLGAVWIHVAFKFPVFSPFSFFLGTCFPNKRLLFMHYSWTVVATFDQVFGEQCTDALFTDPHISLFSNFFIKNESHDTIHTFKNVFATVFSIFNF